MEGRPQGHRSDRSADGDGELGGPFRRVNLGKPAKVRKASGDEPAFTHLFFVCAVNRIISRAECLLVSLKPALIYGEVEIDPYFYICENNGKFKMKGK